ncbi:myotrophin-like [Lytechinus variegatus]|uniref:myotrophin-like n=1 Tax=Lytechinus variegatus TaxID=7654 RepID=UPI001BB13B9E|nr:myotrophin-like [Lytechinus variegatus]
MAGSDAVWAAQNGEVSKLRELQFDAKDKIKGRTLLHIAADFGQHEVIEYLVEQKQADIHSIDSNGFSVLLTAIYGDEGQDRYKKCVAYLLSKGADKNGKAPNGSTFEECAHDEKMRQLLK